MGPFLTANRQTWRQAYDSMSPVCLLAALLMQNSFRMMNAIFPAVIQPVVEGHIPDAFSSYLPVLSNPALETILLFLDSLNKKAKCSSNNNN
jgi:hypothetical protein